jgi:hypothetical protein
MSVKAELNLADAARDQQFLSGPSHAHRDVCPRRRSPSTHFM